MFLCLDHGVVVGDAALGDDLVHSFDFEVFGKVQVTKFSNKS